MKLLHENTVYEFTVAQIGAPESTIIEKFNIEFTHSKIPLRSSSSSSSTPDVQEQRSFSFPRNQIYTQSLIANSLQEFNVPETIRTDMISHFNFYLRNLSLRIGNRRGSINVIVILNVKDIAVERAEEIRRRMETGRRMSENRGTAVDFTVVMPARKSVVESLERERVVVEDDEDEERECSICLEKFGVGEEVVKLPCLHAYHEDCIVRWLERTHFCPFCRFKLPC